MYSYLIRGHDVSGWERTLVSALEDFWQSDRGKDEYTAFLSKYGVLWFRDLRYEDVEALFTV